MEQLPLFPDDSRELAEGEPGIFVEATVSELIAGLYAAFDAKEIPSALQGDVALALLDHLEEWAKRKAGR